MPETDLPPIKGFIKSTLVDWEGLIACELFLPGCNFRCPQCHGSALVARAGDLPDVPIGEVMQHVTENRGWIDGAVLSGGEPTLQPALEQLILLLKSAGLKIKLDTNGSRPELLEEFIGRGLVDFVAMDVKAPLDQRYSAVAGCEVDTAAIRRSVALLLLGGVPYEFRTTVCPRFLDRHDVLDLARDLSGACKLVLQPFRPTDCLDRELESVAPYPLEELRQMAEAARQFVPNCMVRGDPHDEGSPILREA